MDSSPSEQELIRVARELRSLLLSPPCPSPPGYRIGVLNRPAQAVGGDYFDLIRMNDSRLAIVVADVAGKGTSAALVTAMVRGAMRAKVPSSHGPAEVLRDMNHFLHRYTEPELFVTMLMAVLDTRRRFLQVARAGHEPLLHLPADKRGCRIIAPAGLALGMLDNGDLRQADFEEVEITLQPADLFALFTDGITEAANERSERLSTEGLVALLGRVRLSSPEQILRKIRKQLDGFAAGAAQHDDQTLVLVRVENGSCVPHKKRRSVEGLG